jgi:hypothetical protein
LSINPPPEEQSSRTVRPSGPPVNAKLLSLRRLCWFLVLFKISYLLLLSAAILAWPLQKNAEWFPGAIQHWTEDGHLTFGSHFRSWDAAQYLLIAAHGYQAGGGRCAFYPLFPLAIRCFATLTLGNYLVAAVLLANAFSLAASLFFFKIVRKRLGESTALVALALLLAFPGSLFFQFIYTEGLFLFLLMLLVFGLEENHLTLAFVAAFCLPLTRAVGIFSAVLILWHLACKATPVWLADLADRCRSSKRLSNFAAQGKSEQVFARALVSPSSGRAGVYAVLAAPVLGWGVYFFQMWIWTGNAFEGFAAQKQFGFESIEHIFMLPHFIRALLHPTSLHDVTGSVLDRCFFLLVLYCLPSIWRMDKGWFLWTLLSGIVPAMSGTFVSYTRFASVVFPLFIAVASILKESRSEIHYKAWSMGTILLFGVVQIALLWRFVNYRWAG